MVASKRATRSSPAWMVASLLPGITWQLPLSAAFTPSTPAAAYRTHARDRISKRFYFVSVDRWASENDMDIAAVNLEEEEDLEDDNDENARSQFGTRQYWDDVYLGQGDFPAEEYSWYFGWEILEPYVKEFIPSRTATGDDTHILCPGVGNDPILVDLYRSKKYTRMTAFDYSAHAIERQQDILSFELPSKAMDTIELHAMDARKLPNPDWNERFDAIIEKGALDAIYLSGDGNAERAVQNLFRVLKPGGICLSVSGVVPQELRNELFKDWEWLRDGSDELQAGCFVLRKPAAEE